MIKKIIITFIGIVAFCLWNYFMQDKLHSPIMNAVFMFLTAACAITWYYMIRDHSPNIDKLTGLFTPKYFYKKVKNIKSPKYTIMFIDIGDFKNINNVLSMDIGDKLLHMFGQRLSTCFDNGVITRFGGNEFGVLVDHIVPKERLSQITQMLSVPFFIDDIDISVPVNMGVAFFPEHGNNIKNLVRDSSIACSESKKVGKNTYLIYEEQMSENVARRLRIRSDLFHAIENDELVLYYQPQVDIKSGNIVGVEALVRWNHPQLGRLSPVEFIPVAEESGSILALDEWVLRAACKQLKAWEGTEAEHLKISVNLSMQQFETGNLAPMLLKIADEVGVNLDKINVEITETAFMKNANITISSLHEIKQHNLTISIDDFGTGYSALSYLGQLPVDSIKLDKSFIDCVAHDISRRQIISSLVDLARKLDLDLIAEGVESADQLDFLKNLGCNVVQGYLFSPPVTADEVERLLKTAL